MRIGAMEAGGTKMVCAIGDETGKIYMQTSIPTTTPEATMPLVYEFFDSQMAAGKPLDAIGIAAFGPVEVNPLAKNYGTILDTPKLAWKQYPLLAEMKKHYDLPMGLDTDVNAACLGEMVYGSAQGLSNVLYLTVGTGIGAGIAVGGQLVHGMLHPEAGHIRIHPKSGDEENCVCPYHRSCFEGLASGPSLEKRWGRKAIELADAEEVWELEADYIAQALLTYIYTVSPQRIVLGGGVMHQKQLFPRIRELVQEYNQGYLNTPELMDLEQYIVPAGLSDAQGIMGCFQLAVRAV